MTIKLTSKESDGLQSILDAAEEHEGFVNGKDVALIASIIQRAFGSQRTERKKTVTSGEEAK